ncbi:MAG: hypothetical protein HC869_24865 [Rhodospirillales bacterium]|nr:hypothetical protein [Rhodospirillales bacterium]
MAQSLYHFSENGQIARFEPRPAVVPSQRRPGMEWLNGPLVWAIDAAHSPLYFFPRDCPRIVMWKLPRSSEKDIATYWHDSSMHMVAFFEEGWLDRINKTRLFRYELPTQSFLDLNDAGMHVSECGVTPLKVDVLDRLLASFEDAGVEIRPLPELSPLKAAWSTSLHVSGVRLRNAKNWH